MDYYERAGLTPYLEKLGFNLVGYGCTTCIGNSGPLPEEVSAAVNDARPRGRLGAVGQPQLRGPDQPRRQDELPGLAAAGGRLRARRHDGHRPDQRAARHRHRRAAGLPARHLADRRRRSTRSIALGDRARDVHRRTTPTSSPATSAGSRCRPRPATPSPGTPTRPTSASPRTSRAWPAEPHAGHRHRRRPGAGQARRLGHHRPHLARPARSRPTPRPGSYLAEHGVEPARLQLVRLPPRQPRGDDPRHVRQHPAAQPAGARRRGRLHRSTT